MRSLCVVSGRLSVSLTGTNWPLRLSRPPILDAGVLAILLLQGAVFQRKLAAYGRRVRRKWLPASVGVRPKETRVAFETVSVVSMCSKASTPIYATGSPGCPDI